MIVVKDVRGVAQAMLARQERWSVDACHDSLHLVRRFGAHLVGGLNFAKVGDEALQQLAPGLEAIGEDLGGRALGGDRGGGEAAVLLVAVHAAEARETAGLQASLAAAALEGVGATHARLFPQRIAPCRRRSLYSRRRRRSRSIQSCRGIVAGGGRVGVVGGGVDGRGRHGLGERGGEGGIAVGEVGGVGGVASTCQRGVRRRDRAEGAVWPRHGVGAGMRTGRNAEKLVAAGADGRAWLRC